MRDNVYLFKTNITIPKPKSNTIYPDQSDFCLLSGKCLNLFYPFL